MWKAEKYLIAKPDGSHEVDGFTNGAGLGLHLQQVPNVQGFLRPEWVVTHLNSGHSVANIIGPEQFALEVANEIAAVLDWNFKCISTFVRDNMESLEEVLKIIKKYDPFVSRDAGKQPYDGYAVAEEIATTRGAL